MGVTPKLKWVTQEKIVSTKKGKTRVFRSSSERRHQIVTAALQCLQDVGYVNLTARKITQYSDVSLGHITYHFKDMEEVLATTYHYASKTLLEATQKSLSESPNNPMDRLKAFLQTGFATDFLKQEYIRVRIDLWSAAQAHDDIALTELRLYQSYRESLLEILEAIANERNSDTEALPFLADHIMATLDGLWLDWARRQDLKAVQNGLEGCTILVDAVLKK